MTGTRSHISSAFLPSDSPDIEAITLSTVDLSGLAWRKSSRSGQDASNGNCVEVAFASAEWRKSSRSGQASNGNCVEVAFAGPVIAVRDSKSTSGDVLAFPSPGWSSFLRVTQL